MTTNTREKPTTFAGLLYFVATRNTSLFLGTAVALWIGIRWGLGNPTWYDALLVAILAIFTSPTELLMHKYVLHHAPGPLTIFGRKIWIPDFAAARHHRRHHHSQMKTEFMFIPPSLAVIVVSALSAGAILLGWLHKPLFALGADVCCFVIMRVLWQEVCHYMSHCRTYRPTVETWWARYHTWITTRHQAHHTWNEEYYWVVSALDWSEAVLRWYRRRTNRLIGDIPRSSTVQNLGLISDDEGRVIDTL
jgi:hypothetical protein